MNAEGDTGDESNADIKQGGILTADKNLWVLGNYSRFIRPGYQRVQVEGADELNGLMGTAWLSPDSATLVAVFVNMDKGSREVSLSLEGFDVEEVNTYVTDKSHNLQLDPDQKDATSLKLPSRSVVTVVMPSAIDPDGMASILRSSPKEEERIYDLCGRRVSRTGKGIYIIGGRKVVK